MTDDEQIRRVRARVSECGDVLAAMDGIWPRIALELERQRMTKMEMLVVAEDQELRGRIKQIDDLLLLPQYLRREIENLSSALP